MQPRSGANDPNPTPHRSTTARLIVVTPAKDSSLIPERSLSAVINLKILLYLDKNKLEREASFFQSFLLEKN